MSHLRAVVEAVREAGYDGYVAAPGPNMCYVAGIAPEGHERILCLVLRSSGEPVWLAPWNASAQLRAESHWDVYFWRDRDGPEVAIRSILGNGGRFAVDGHMQSRHLHTLRSALVGSATTLENGHGLVERLREVKTADELALIRSAARLACQVILAVQDEGLAGRSEDEVARRLLVATAAAGAAPAFPPIVAAGPGSAEPHHFPGERVLPGDGAVLVDYGVALDGYHADTTRMFLPPCLAQDLDDAVGATLDAFRAALAVVRPGVPAEEVDRARREVLTRAGYGHFMSGRTGHGIGLEVHEGPFIVEGNLQPLVVGQVFTIEPGVYLPGRWGVRYENMVVVTEGGAEVIEALPDRLDLK